MPSKARLYAEVILPLPLFGTFTYSIPTTLEGKAAVGHRVIVPFGRKKYYTGIIESITPVAPEGFEVKDISSVLDPWPVVKHPQLKLWEWIAEYYLCTAGDVYKAAVPAGLKVESETFIELNPDYEEMPDARMTDREAIIMQSLDHNGKMTPAEISKKTGLNSIESTISSMVERRMLIIAEKLIERYRPKKETLVRLAVDRNDNEAMHKVFDAVKGAKKQEMMLITLLDNLNKRQQQQLRPKFRDSICLNRAACRRPSLPHSHRKASWKSSPAKSTASTTPGPSRASSRN